MIKYKRDFSLNLTNQMMDKWLLSIFILNLMVTSTIAKPPYVDIATTVMQEKLHQDVSKFKDNAFWNVEDILYLPQQSRTFNGTWTKGKLKS